MNSIKIGGTKFPWREIEVSVHSNSVSRLSDTRTLMIGTGAVSLATYLTADELRKFGSALTREADLMDSSTREVA